jgi:hypothetical protein
MERNRTMKRRFSIRLSHGQLLGELDLPDFPRGLILVVSAHNIAVDHETAANLAARGYAVFSMELLTQQEAQFADASQNVPRLTERLLDLLDLIRHDGDMQDLPLAIYAIGESTPAAVRATAQRDAQVKVLICHGGMVDRAGLQALNLLTAPLLMLLDADDTPGHTAFTRAASHLSSLQQMQILNPGDDPVSAASNWLTQHLHMPQMPV